MKKKQNKRIKLAEESGAVMLIAALFITVALGFMTLAIDEGSWLNRKSTNQNAVDSAALVAATEIFQNGSTDDAAVHDAALNAAYLNGLTTDDDVALHVYGPGTMDNHGNIVPNDEVMVALTSVTDNYYAQAVTGRDETTVYAEATAKAERVSDQSAVIPNAAVEAYDFIWSGGSSRDTVIRGGITTANNISITSAATMTGDISSDGKTDIHDGGGTIINGTVNAKNSVNITGQNIINGSLESVANITWNSSGGHVTGNVKANGKIMLNRMVVDGSVEGKGIVSFIGPGGTVGGDILSETGVIINGGNYPAVVDGTIHTAKSNLLPYQVNGMHKSDGSPADFQAYSGQKITPVTHQDYVWRWESLKKMPEISHCVTADDLAAFANRDVIRQEYGDWGWLGFGGAGHFDPRYYKTTGTVTFSSPKVFKEFVEYLQKEIGSTTPIYFPGSLYIQGNSDKGVAVTSAVVVEKDINYQAPCNFKGAKVSFISMNGNITLGNGGGAEINGAVICLKEGSNIQLNNDHGKITGGIISHGNVTMNGDWSVIADTEWEENLPVNPTGSKIVIKLAK